MASLTPDVERLTRFPRGSNIGSVCNHRAAEQLEPTCEIIVCWPAHSEENRFGSGSDPFIVSGLRVDRVAALHHIIKCETEWRIDCFSDKLPRVRANCIVRYQSNRPIGVGCLRLKRDVCPGWKIRSSRG